MDGRNTGEHEPKLKHIPIPRFLHSLRTLSIAIYPLFARSQCMLCLHTITPTGSDAGCLLENACKCAWLSKTLSIRWDILEKIDEAWMDGRSSINANNVNERWKRAKPSKQEATMNKGDDGPLMQKVPKSVNDIRLGKLALNEGHDIRQI